jgi:16S rRNA processing protein RimM
MAGGDRAPRLEVGRVAKAHGLRGEVAVELVTDREERVAPGARLWAGGEVLEIVASRPHQGRWLVTFAGVADRTAAERLAGRPLEAEALDDPEALWVHDLIGTAVVEVDGTQRGTVVSVVANPAHDLLELDSGALVPVVFVRSSERGVTTIEPPPGLFD